MIISGEPAGVAPALDERPADPAAQPSPPATGPPAAGLPGQQRPAARRIAAALVDIVLLTGLLVIMSVTVGTFTVGGGNVDFHVDGVWALVYAALLLVYFFTLEAAAGQTVGKCLLGLRVVGTDGSRPSAAAIAGRTVLRIVDGLPLLYLAGFITMMATGRRRQRLGDLAAGTAVTRAVPPPHRGLAAAALALVLLTAAGLAYRANPGGTPANPVTSAGGTYRGHDVSFSYPVTWSAESAQENTAGGANPLWTTAVGPGTPLDLIVVEAYQFNVPVTVQNIDALVPVIAVGLQHAGATMQGTAQMITMAGMPAFQFRVTGTSGGSRYESTLVFAFSGTTEYFVNCQYTPSKATEVQRACGQVAGSFRAGPAVATQDNPQAAQAQPGAQAGQPGRPPAPIHHISGK